MPGSVLGSRDLRMSREPTCSPETYSQLVNRHVQERVTSTKQAELYRRHWGYEGREVLNKFEVLQHCGNS